MDAFKKMLSRARQKSEEVILNAEKTEIGPEIEQLLAKADKTEEHLKKLIHAIEVYMQPNPTIRALDPRKDKSSRQNTLDALGETMKEAAKAIDVDSAYGGALLKAAQAEAKMGASERQLMHSVTTQILTSIRNLLDNELRAVQKERTVLQKKRLDLDASKSRWKRASSTAAKATAEPQLRAAQVEFNSQLEAMHNALVALQEALDRQADVLAQFVDAQLQHTADVLQILNDLKRAL